MRSRSYHKKVVIFIGGQHKKKRSNLATLALFLLGIAKITTQTIHTYWLLFQFINSKVDYKKKCTFSALKLIW